jgi:hypothetical protein
MTVSDHALDTAKGLHHEANRHRRELGVEFREAALSTDRSAACCRPQSDTSGSNSGRVVLP